MFDVIPHNRVVWSQLQHHFLEHLNRVVTAQLLLELLLQLQLRRALNHIRLQSIPEVEGVLCRTVEVHVLFRRADLLRLDDQLLVDDFHHELLSLGGEADSQFGIRAGLHPAEF